MMTYRVITNGQGEFRIQYRTWPTWTDARANLDVAFTSLKEAVKAIPQPRKWTEVYRTKVL
jgi:hypothetical protein